MCFKCFQMSKNCQAIHLTPVWAFFDMLKICLSAASFSPYKQVYDILLKKGMTSNIATRLQSTTLTRMPYRSGSSACWGCSGCSCGGCFFWCILLLGVPPCALVLHTHLPLPFRPIHFGGCESCVFCSVCVHVCAVPASFYMHPISLLTLVLCSPAVIWRK